MDFFTSGEFSYVSVLPVALFGMVAAATWWAMQTIAARRPRAEERLDEINDPSRRRGAALDGPVSRTEAMTRVIEKAAPALAKPLRPKTADAVGKLQMRLTHAGFRGETAPTVFLGLKFIGLVIGLLLSGGTLLLTTGITQPSVMKAIMFAGGMFFLPDILVWWCARKRKEKIFLGLPDALDLMVVCVEAGLGLDQAMRKVAEEMKKSYRVIAEEFALCNFHLQMGKARTDVLHDLGERTGVEDIKALTTIIIQAEKFGSSIGQALRVQSDSMRTRRSQLAEEKAAKTAVKLIFPLVLFIFPGIFVVLVGPAAITMINEMLPAMGG